MMTQTFLVLCLAVQGLLVHAAGSAPLPARPPLGKHVGFISNGNSAKNSGSISSSNSNSNTRSRSNQGRRFESPLLSPTPSGAVTSAGIRSACAREKAATPRRMGEASASAATRLRGGSWGPGYAPFVPQLLHAADKPKKEVSYDRLDSCTERDTANGAGSAQYATSKQRVVEEEEEDEDIIAESGGDADLMSGGTSSGGSGGGGGGGGRVGTLPSFPRSFSAGSAKTAPVNKKFAWVP